MKKYSIQRTLLALSVAACLVPAYAQSQSSGSSGSSMSGAPGSSSSPSSSMTGSPSKSGVPGSTMEDPSSREVALRASPVLGG
jgi:hypothetical protein